VRKAYTPNCFSATIHNCVAIAEKKYVHIIEIFDQRNKNKKRGKDMDKFDNKKNAKPREPKYAINARSSKRKNHPTRRQQPARASL
jgi:hypothetical protein